MGLVKLFSIPAVVVLFAVACGATEALRTEGAPQADAVGRLGAAGIVAAAAPDVEPETAEEEVAGPTHSHGEDTHTHEVAVEEEAAPEPEAVEEEEVVEPETDGAEVESEIIYEEIVELEDTDFEDLWNEIVIGTTEEGYPIIDESNRPRVWDLLTDDMWELTYVFYGEDTKTTSTISSSGPPGGIIIPEGTKEERDAWFREQGVDPDRVVHNPITTYKFPATTTEAEAKAWLRKQGIDLSLAKIAYE